MEEHAPLLSTLKAFVTSPLFTNKQFLDYLASLPNDVSEQAKTLQQLSTHFEAYSKAHNSAPEHPLAVAKKKPVIGLVEGVYDMTHVGHFNSIRQARKMVDRLIVLVNGDESTEKMKSPLVFNEQERLMMVKACKWTDEAHVFPEYIVPNDILEQFGADVLLHGDDIIVDKNGNNIYDHWIKKGQFKVFRRTHGISTSDIVERVLNLENDEYFKKNPKVIEKGSKGKKMLNSISRIISFYDESSRPPKKGKVGLAAGSFDLLNFGHIAFLEKARSLCDFLIIGLYEDSTVKSIRGKNYPVFSINERMMNLLSLKYVDDIVVNTPFKIMPDYIEQFEIDIVFEGKYSYNPVLTIADDPYEAIRKTVNMVEIDSGVNFTLKDNIKRIKENKEKIEVALNKKLAKQATYYENDEKKDEKEKVKEIH